MNQAMEVGHVYSMETIENKLSKLLYRVKYRWVDGYITWEQGNQVRQL